MNAPIKPLGGGKRHGAVVLVPDTLTGAERLMVASYRATAPEWRSESVDFANTLSKMFPLVKEIRPAAGPAIRLVGLGDKGGAK
ncbi:hypothetical protein ACFDR9_005455 [Janthinobacterium sp. CG_23.3]|uniref:hypothetical protein n=1 Tax=Janthinobacterium sp. CG_23.3 TaxID=3349634 RepID=UPI0038D3DFEE